MGLEEEWLSSLVGKRTQDNYKREFKVFKEYMKKTSEEILQLRKEEGKRFITRLVMFFDYLQKKKGCLMILWFCFPFVFAV